jgi:hypothetical protein
MYGCVVCKMFWKSEGAGEPLYEKQTTPRSIDMQVSDRPLQLESALSENMRHSKSNGSKYSMTPYCGFMIYTSTVRLPMPVLCHDSRILGPSFARCILRSPSRPCLSSPSALSYLLSTLWNLSSGLFCPFHDAFFLHP